MGKTSLTANKKYQQRVYRNIACRLPKDLVEQFRDLVKMNGDSQAAIIKAAMENYIKEKTPE